MMKNLLTGFIVLLAFGCVNQKQVSQTANKADGLPQKPKRSNAQNAIPNNESTGISAQINAFLSSKNEFENSNIGLLVVDPSTQKTIFSKNADKYFIPASNIKILTLYSCLKTLADSIPAFKYISNQNAVKIWGLGDPSFLHPDLPPSKTFDFLKTFKTIELSTANSQLISVGDGWSWEDYNEGFFVDRSILPIYGNIVRVLKKPAGLVCNPMIFAKNMHANGNTETLKRDLNVNNFRYKPNTIFKDSYKQSIPFKTSDSLLVQLLADTLGRKVVLTNEVLPSDAHTFYSMPIDTVYKRMMYFSDNMLAEQLLLLCCNTDSVSSENAIKKAQTIFFAELPQKIRWVDGSGNSRYNLITPTDLVFVLNKMLNEFPKEKLFDLFPKGGQIGTLQNSYKAEKPYVFAKTGSMSGVYNQSGYIITKTGKLLIFSIMNNNFVGPVSNIRQATNAVMMFIKDNY